MSVDNVLYESQGRTQITIRTEKGCIVGQRILRRERVLVRDHGIPVSYPDCGDIYPAALAQARGWLSEFANQNTEISYDDQGRVQQVITRDQTGVTLIATKTLFRNDQGFLDRVEIVEAVSGKTIVRKFIRDTQNKILSIDRTFTRAT